MDNKLWTEVKDIFDSALELPEESRYNYIKERCRGNFRLFSEVESLLDSFGRAGTFIENGISFANNIDEANDPLINQVIGSYKIIKKLAGGGMGCVYLGERSDKQYIKQVAIKLINPGLSHGAIIKRFRNERQALANLDHPNIARLLDGGTTSNGVPYFIMEYIAGDPVNKYCDNNKLKITERLKLFRTICSAVHFAHQNLIIHRDIKPENIIVTKDGIPKLLDFGIAKILDSNNDEYVYDGLTKPGAWHLTPEYASPEQILGENVTTSTDIYSLGVLLYVLLTGHQPYRFYNSNPADLNNIISKEIPQRPSHIVTTTEERMMKDGQKISIDPGKVSSDRSDSPDKLRKNLSGDLDNIIQMAMRKEPSRRYLSVQQFSEDIQRHLKGMTVIARHDTFSYRTSKFIGRHKIGFTSVILIALLVITGISAVLWQSEVASKQRDKARLEAGKAEEVKKFLQDMLSAADPSSSGKDVKVVDILKHASEEINYGFKNQPKLQAELFTTVGNTYEGLGLYDESEIYLNNAVRFKKKIYSVNSAEYARSLNDLALLMHYMGRITEADSLYKIALGIYDNLSYRPPSEYTDILNNYAVLLCDEGSFEESEIYLRRALVIARKLKTELLGSTINNLAITVDYLGRTDEAGKLYKEAYLFFHNKYGDVHPRVATAINNMAFVSTEQKDYREAAELFKQALDMKIKIYGNTHPELGLAYHNYASSLYFNGNYRQSEIELNNALKIYKISFDDKHAYYANTYHWLGRVLIAEKRYKDAEVFLRKAYALRLDIFKNPKHHSVASSGSELGYCLALQGRYKEAGKLLNDNYAILESTLSKDNDFTLTARDHLNEFNVLSRSNKKSVAERPAYSLK
jgi:eukaryotic-like serine/threonine-protein kinase